MVFSIRILPRRLGLVLNIDNSHHVSWLALVSRHSLSKLLYSLRGDMKPATSGGDQYTFDEICVGQLAWTGK